MNNKLKELIQKILQNIPNRITKILIKKKQKIKCWMKKLNNKCIILNKV